MPCGPHVTKAEPSKDHHVDLRPLENPRFPESDPTGSDTKPSISPNLRTADTRTRWAWGSWGCRIQLCNPHWTILLVQNCLSLYFSDTESLEQLPSPTTEYFCLEVPSSIQLTSSWLALRFRGGGYSPDHAGIVEMQSIGSRTTGHHSLLARVERCRWGFHTACHLSLMSCDCRVEIDK